MSSQSQFSEFMGHNGGNKLFAAAQFAFALGSPAKDSGDRRQWPPVTCLSAVRKQAGCDGITFSAQEWEVVKALFDTALRNA